MDHSLEQAHRCINIAKQSINEGNFEKAERMLQKSLRLHQTKAAEDLIRQLNDNKKTSNGDATAQTNNNNNHENNNPRQRKESFGSAKESSPSSATTPKYSKEEMESVNKILRCKDYYEILSVTKEAGEEELKKSYRKLALKFHPDKNQAPRAAEAFKAIGNAFAVLSNSDKRRRYDQYGNEEDNLQQSSANSNHSTRYYTYSRGFEAEVSPEDIFNMFFGGGFPSSNLYRQPSQRQRFRAQQHHQHQETAGSNYSTLLQCLPILIVFGMSFFSGLFIRDLPYNLSPTTKYTHLRTTKNLQVTYYVKDTFTKDYQGTLADLERDVEEDYIHNLRNACLRERQYKENMLFRARYNGDQVAYNKAYQMRVPNCDQLSKLSQR